MAHKKRKKHKKETSNMNSDAYCYEDFNNNSNTINRDANSSSSNTISDEDKESLRLLSMQLKAILIDYYGETLLWNATMQGILYILEKYDNIEGNEHDTTLTPDIVALQSTEVFLAAKIIFANVAFTRFHIVSQKKAEGTFRYSLQPNRDINTANVLNLISSYYYIRAAKGIVPRDNTQPVFGI